MSLPVLRWRRLVFFVLLPILIFLPFVFAGWLHFNGYVKAAYFAILVIAAMASQAQKQERNPVAARISSLIVWTTGACGGLALAVGDTVFGYSIAIPLMATSIAMSFIVVHLRRTT